MSHPHAATGTGRAWQAAVAAILPKKPSCPQSLLSGHCYHPAAYRVCYQSVREDEGLEKKLVLDYFIGNGIFDQFYIGMETHFFKYPSPESTDGVVTQCQFSGNLSGRHSCSQHAEHFFLPFR